MVTVARATGPVASAGSRKGWLASIKDEALSFVKGDNNAPWAILAETVIGCVPVLGQIVDARDIIKGLVEVSSAPASPLAWFNLITALIGLVPGGGDAVKRGLRAVKSRAIPVADLLDTIRRFYKGDPEKALKEALDLGKLQRLLNQMLDNPALTRRLSPEVRRSIDQIQTNLNRQFTAFKREIDSWLPQARKTSAESNPTRGKAAPVTKPRTQVQAGTQGKGQGGGGTASTNTPNAAQQRTARWKTLAAKVLGVMGEHMADYHCQDIKGWGHKMRHDENGVNTAKLNDGGHLVQLWPCIPRGRGIDAVWKSGGAKPYAIIEAKASFDPTKGIKALLGEAGDKTGSGNSNSGGLQRRGGSGGGAAKGSTSIRQTNGKVTQMGHGWIQRRLLTISLTNPADKARLLRDKERAYSRHVFLFSIPHAISHAEALIKLTTGHQVPHAFHSAHQTTREWRDSDIDKVVDNRAGFEGPARNR